MINDGRMEILEDEVLILRDSGEIPEIAYHATLYYLTEDEEGPGLDPLSAEELALLQEAALFRYQQIVLRDLDPDNRDLGIYRGIRRTIYNWQRMQDFCRRLGRDCSFFKKTAAQALLNFLTRELDDVINRGRTSAVNCSAERIVAFADVLDISPDTLPTGWQELCPESTRRVCRVEIS